MWRVRHLQSHHIFPNIDHCDADIDENPFIRLSPSQPIKPWHRFQHLYAWLLYMVVAPHAAWVQDLNYLNRPTLANMMNWQKQTPTRLSFLLFKIPNLMLFYALPVLTLPFPSWHVILGSLIIQGMISLLFILPLVGTHFSVVATFPQNTDGKIAHSYVTHQLVTSVDWNPTSKSWCSLVGGLNAHAAHHLFPRVSHRHYHWISKEILYFTERHKIPYRHVTLSRAIMSHAQFLKRMSRECDLSF